MPQPRSQHRLPFLQVKKIKLPEAKEIGQYEEDNMIDGYLMDCGGKEEKYLSRAKCTAVTTMEHPHRRNEDIHGNVSRTSAIYPLRCIVP